MARLGTMASPGAMLQAFSVAEVSARVACIRHGRRVHDTAGTSLLLPLSPHRRRCRPTGTAPPPPLPQVGEWLQKLELPATIIEKFAANSVAGGDLATLSDEDLTKELGCSSLQARPRPACHICPLAAERLAAERRRPIAGIISARCKPRLRLPSAPLQAGT